MVRGHVLGFNHSAIALAFNSIPAGFSYTFHGIWVNIDQTCMDIPHQKNDGPERQGAEQVERHIFYNLALLCRFKHVMHGMFVLVIVIFIQDHVPLVGYSIG